MKTKIGILFHEKENVMAAYELKHKSCLPCLYILNDDCEPKEFYSYPIEYLLTKYYGWQKIGEL